MEHPSASKDPSVLQIWKSPEYILLADSQFKHRIQNAVFDAIDDAGTENRTYILYSLIMSQSCTAVETSLYPDASVAANPQMLFGNRTISSEIRPLINTSNEDDTEDAAALAGEDVEVEAATKPPPEAGAVSPTRVPDFARILIFGQKLARKGHKRELLDFWELKRMKTINVPWASNAGKRFARRDLVRRVEQIYEAAMAAFDHNPHWMKVTALLIIGIYFTQLVWSRPQTADKALPASAPPATADPSAGPPSSAGPHTGSSTSSSSADPHSTVSSSTSDPSITVPSSSVDPTTLPPSIEASSTTLPPSIEPDSTAPLLDPTVVSPGPTDHDKYFEGLAKVQEAIARDLRDRCMPDIYFFNECCFETVGIDFTGRLSDKFLDALFLPIRDNCREDLQFVHQPSWFDRSQYPPPEPMALSEEGVQAIRDRLQMSASVSESVQALTGELKRPDGRQDGYQTPSSAPASPFPSPQKGGRRPVAALPKREFNRKNRGKRVEPPSLAAVAQSSAGSSKTEPKPKPKTRAKGIVTKKKGGPKA